MFDPVIIMFICIMLSIFTIMDFRTSRIPNKYTNIFLVGLLILSIQSWSLLLIFSVVSMYLIYRFLLWDVIGGADGKIFIGFAIAYPIPMVANLVNPAILILITSLVFLGIIAYFRDKPIARIPFIPIIFISYIINIIILSKNYI